MAQSAEQTLMGRLGGPGLFQSRERFLLRACRQASNPLAKRSSSDNKLTAGFDADVMLRRSDFGVGRYAPMTGDELSVHITVEAGQD
jgi:hypothetical protein